MSAMTREAAREILGLAIDVSDEEVRRAYVRLVKRHKPDRDPEGFRRVREAYERLLAAEPSPPAPIPAPIAAPVPAPIPAPPVVPSEAPIDAPPVEPKEPAPPERRSERRVELRGVPPSRLPDVLGEHLARHPSDDPVRFDAVRALASLGRFSEAIAMLEGGVRDGQDPRPFLVQIALWRPEAIDGERLERLRDDPETEPYAAVVLLTRGQHEEAERVTSTALARDAAMGRSRRATWQRVIAGLFERGGITLARRTLARLAPVTRADALSPEQLLQAVLLAELDEIAQDVEVPLARLLGTFIGSQVHAHAVIRGDPDLYPRHAKKIASVERRAPQLMQLTFPPSLRGRAAKRRDARIVLSVVGALVATIVGFGFYDQLIDHEPLERSAPTRVLCAERGERDGACGRARTVDYFLELDNCRNATSALRSLAFTSDASPSTRQQIERQSDRVTERCGSRR